MKTIFDIFYINFKMKNNKLKIEMYKKYYKITKKLNIMHFLNNFLINYFVFLLKTNIQKHHNNKTNNKCADSSGMFLFAMNFRYKLFYYDVNHCSGGER